MAQIIAIVVGALAGFLSGAGSGFLVHNYSSGVEMRALIGAAVGAVCGFLVGSLSMMNPNKQDSSAAAGGILAAIVGALTGAYGGYRYDVLSEIFAMFR